VHIRVNPVDAGGRTRFFPAGVRLVLDLVEARGFDSGVAALRCAEGDEVAVRLEVG
jgi:hypothetical protein